MLAERRVAHPALFRLVDALYGALEIGCPTLFILAVRRLSASAEPSN